MEHISDYGFFFQSHFFFGGELSHFILTLTFSNLKFKLRFVLVSKMGKVGHNPFINATFCSFAARGEFGLSR